jgi:predicted TIM-barrel fold metal-dependent hydrolase
VTIIDARVRLPQELRPNPRYSAPARQAEQYDKVLDLRNKMNTGTMDALLSTMCELGIGAAVMHAESEGGEDCDALNAALAEVLAEYPDTFRGVGVVDLIAAPGRIARQAVRVADAGMLGLSLQPSFFGLDIDARTLYPMYARAEELGLLVAVHTGINYSRLHPIRHERAEMLDQVACDFPDLTIIAAHGGWPWATEYAAVARRHPTVYLEFGGLAPKYVAKPGSGWDAMFTMMSNLLRDQILYGSDWPTMQPSRAVAEWQESGLGDSTLTALLHDNAAALFGIDMDAAARR